MNGSFRYRLYQRTLAAFLRWQSRGRVNPFTTGITEALVRELSPGEVRLLDSVEAMRLRYKEDFTSIDIQDSGAGNLIGRRKPRRTVASIVKSSAISPSWGIILFRLVRFLRPRSVLELGTNLGISAGYILSALTINGQDGRLVTVEGDPTLAGKAREQVDRLAPGRCRVVNARFQDVLPTLVGEMKPIDLAFIDGHHEYDATIANFEWIRPGLSEGACVLFDDVDRKSVV